MACSVFHLLVILLGICHLLSLTDAVPVTRIEKLWHGNGIQTPQVIENAHLQASIEKNLEQEVVVVKGRILTVEVNDYPGSGANNRHTPRPQVGRCVDC
ncbi:putative Disulfide bond formation protein B 2 [Tripterygium wilfordii]|uniref:Putative Disulfide bond formation protein B 2 n=1 Tax=Tripterygium wilfordii TaxID=458696 RepID=A0A7J7CJG0_TRIWF|nr:uncharacterized protein LOC119981500 [Tripterygium wilfordii]KAF5734141.1 putative Disulfide bond formation protein B 2 [Tripterygium wilfordii]